MLQIFVNANYDFVGKRRWFYLASGGLMLLSVVWILFGGGLHYGIDFTGGALIQVRYDKPATVDLVRRGLDEIQLGNAVIQQFGDAQEYLIRLPQGGEKLDQLSKQVQDALAKVAGARVEIRRIEFVGPQVGRDLQLQALYAVLAGMGGILLYVAFRFQFRDGVISVVAIAHDVIVTLGMMSVTHREMSLPMLAALLTIVGYSINDTIVVFDRIRESRGKGLRKGQDWAEVVNASMNQTLSRTVLTSFTVFLSALVLFLFGGEVLRDFSFALLVGVVTGTYSSIAAASLVMDWEIWSRARGRTSGKVASKAKLKAKA
jgi:preprotein translocase subunit SecF